MRTGCRSLPALGRSQRGVVLTVTLIVLLILLLGGIALTRSFDTSLLVAGKLGFKRDLVNQGERGFAAALNLFRSGALVAETARNADAYASNYSAVRLASDARGIPRVLVDDAAFASLSMSGADIVDSASGIRIRYVIDRQCAALGPFNPQGCALVPRAGDVGGSSFKPDLGGREGPIYRISVRVTGPRGTQAFFQTTVSI